MKDNLGGRIAELLTQLNMTQRELADKVNVTEVSMSRYIKGDRVPKGPVIANIATALHTTTDYLLNGDGETEIKMAVELPQKDIDILISHGAKPLPIVEPENKKRWLERISGIDCATDGVYFLEQGKQEQECKFLIYDNDSHVLYYYLSIM